MAIGPWLEELFARADGDGTPYLGLDPDTATERAHEVGIADVRIIPVPFPPGVVLLMDRRFHRLNLAVEDGRVIRAGFF